MQNMEIDMQLTDGFIKGEKDGLTWQHPTNEKIEFRLQVGDKFDGVKDLISYWGEESAIGFGYEFATILEAGYMPRIGEDIFIGDFYSITSIWYEPTMVKLIITFSIETGAESLREE